MANPVANLQRTAAEFKQMDAKDKRRFITDSILNNALYILMVLFCIYTWILRLPAHGSGHRRLYRSDRY